MNQVMKLRPAFVQRLWGGRLLQDKLELPCPEGTGEAWILSALEQAPSATEEGCPFYERVGRDFPLLIKLIGAEQRLSVQVHPSDENCLPGEHGKAEAWVVLAAPENARLIFGTKGNREDFQRALDENRVEEVLGALPIHVGDVLDIRPGVLHAITEGVVVYEVQQSSDTTYRFYDWNRVDAQGKPRALHVQRAMAVTDFSAKATAAVGTAHAEQGCTVTDYIHNPYFHLTRIDMPQAYTEHCRTGWVAYTMISGSAKVEGRDAQVGDTYFAPVNSTFHGEGCASWLRASL